MRDHIRFLMIAAVAALATGVLPSTEPCRAEEKRPNVVFFLVDDLGYMDIGAYNRATFYETPNVDRIAEQGMRFTDGYAANPVCSPTRYSIMTGKHPSRIDATNFFSGRRSGKFRCAPLFDRMPREEITLAETLGRAGYKSAFLGKWHLGPTEEFWPKAQGFDVNVAGHSAGGPFKCGYFSPYFMPTIADGPAGEHLPERLSRDACGIIDKFRQGDEPFLVYLSFYSVHTPLKAPKALIEKYEKKAAALPDAGAAEFAEEEQVSQTDRPRQVRIRQCHAVYAAMIESMDRAVGRVLDKLEEAGLDENTIVLFMSDNGGLSTSEGSPTSNLPLRGGKGWVYEGGIREPYMIKWPGVTRPGSTCSVPVVSTDFYPTLLDAAGLDAIPEQHLDGVSLVPLLRGGDSLDRDALYWHYPHYSNQGGIPGGAIRMGRYKLIERYEDGRVHLYDLETDVGERNDLAEKMPERITEMRSRLHAWYKQVDAKFLQPHPDGPQPWRPGD
ncbi:MAG: sulfatase [Candidatus Nealsonbacteria bacterium]|nr:sulfatase [Candidatus Nealsonbacteria bacterium]